MKPKKITLSAQRGFALVVTLSLMILLTIIAVGLLTLSTISLRTTGQGEAIATARANARLALMLALGELQKAAGDDRRVTVDGSIFAGAKNPNVVGVWKSWSPKLAENPTAGAPDYGKKNQQFVSWLTSCGTPSDLASLDWAKTGTLANPTELFTLKSDGFQLAGSRIEIKNGISSGGALAWAVVQDATRAKINVAGPENASLVANDCLQAQPRPSLAKSANYKQANGDWNKRANRVISMAQAELDGDLWKGGTAALEGADFTAQGLGLLTDVVNGGLKTDLSLGFEMSSADFGQDTWGSFKNPFRAASVPQMDTPPKYRGERPVFKPLTDSASVHVDLNYSPANAVYEFPAAAVPTFDILRSFYRTPYHLYNTDDGPTVFERGMDHVALKQPQPASHQYVSPGATPLGLNSQTGYRPVLDRLLFVLSVGLTKANEACLIITPVVTLWNPYNVALEIEGAVVYPWIDFPFWADWEFYDKNKVKTKRTAQYSTLLAAQFPGKGRSVNPYFFASITPDGSGTASAGRSIRFKPGEVRVFVPSSTALQELDPSLSIRQRSLNLRPVDNSNEFSLRGGFAVSKMNPVSGSPSSQVLSAGDSVKIAKFVAITGADYAFFLSLEDATRTKLSNPQITDRGQLEGDVQTANFTLSGATANMTTAILSYADVSNPAVRQPFGMIETYHRVAGDPSSSRRSDLVFTTNPRQPFVNRYLTTGNFLAGPHYETRMRSISSINQILETDNGGRSAFYGPSNNSNTGESALAFFEVPQSAVLSLAAFQHADLSGTSYSSAYQFGNSWASAYLKREASAEKIPAGNGGSGDATYKRAEMPVYDLSYLANEAIWDSFFLSGASPGIQPGTATGTPGVWNSPIATVTSDLKKTLTDFIEDPVANPLRNPRMRLHTGSFEKSVLKSDLVKPEGCLKLAANLMVDGAFNVNSTSEKAWTAFLSGMRDRSFTVRDGSSPAAGNTAFPRFRDPLGTDSNLWMGFRSLSDSQIGQLASNIVAEVKKRGPFLSLAEFINRRIDNSDLGLKGAVQSAIDGAGFNSAALYDTFDTSGYPANGKSNIAPANTGVGIPGYLTQADILQSIAPVITARSDTFTVRAYGEARDTSGRVTGTAWCEAVVQRMPEFLDQANPPHAGMTSLNPVNLAFGRRFAIVSFRYLSKNEVML